MSPGPAIQFDRQEALRNAMDVFWTQGYEATGLSELTECMGIGRQSLYNTFGDKRALFLEVMDVFEGDCVQPQIDLLKAPGSPLGNIRAVFRIWAEMVAETNCKGCLYGNTSAEFGVSDPEIAERVRETFQSVEDAFYGALKRAKEAGELSTGVKSRDLARLIVNTGQGLAVLGQVKEGSQFAKSVLESLLSLMSAK